MYIVLYSPMFTYNTTETAKQAGTPMMHREGTQRPSQAHHTGTATLKNSPDKATEFPLEDAVLDRAQPARQAGRLTRPTPSAARFWSLRKIEENCGILIQFCGVFFCQIPWRCYLYLAWRVCFVGHHGVCFEKRKTKSVIVRLFWGSKWGVL